MILDKIFVYGVSIIIPLVFILVLIQLCGWWRFMRCREARKTTATTDITNVPAPTPFAIGDGAPDYNHITFDNSDINDDEVLPPYSTAIAMDTLQSPTSPISVPDTVPAPAYVSQQP
ncbi:hypothetical protein BGZ97_000143 [Linnemannia gamsii]|uniref:Uncharacterized protein n=1 Tax=Linnemannia gamsii TaxID=64522 RepID=A0A9P6UKL2_9FUNG|nr:hypothetical protein BGZ97_000143 [Linnemannia gamsii]